MTLPKSFSLTIQCIILNFIIPQIYAQFQFLNSRCGNSTFTPNTSYASNINTVLESFSSDNQVAPYGYYNFSAGQVPNKVEAMVLCRGDVPQGACRLCVQSSASALPRVCPNQKQAFGYTDNCIIF
ncbi:hypothetical protein vseg_011302 [Gypsophila vaccaria]